MLNDDQNFWFILNQQILYVYLDLQKQKKLASLV